MFGLNNIIRGMRKGQFLIPIPKPHWMKYLDEDRPLNDRCVCGGNLYLAKGCDNVAGCSSCGLAYLLILITNPLDMTYEMIEKIKLQKLLKHEV